MSDILEFQGVHRSFDGTMALDGVSFAMQPESVVGLLGRNGAGKTTLIKIAMGMLYPHEGQVRVFGLSPTKEPVAVKSRVGFVSEEQILPSDASIGELLSLHRHLFKRWDCTLERELLDRFALGNMKQTIKQLSKGQARQLALICAVCHRPELLILDEPAGGLDPAARREFLETSIQLLNREGSAILFSSHHMGDVERLGGRVVLLHRGRVFVDRELDQLREAFSVVTIAERAVANMRDIEETPGCKRVRRVRDEWRAVFEGTPEQVREQLNARLGYVDAQCTTVPLEELFVELVGNEHAAEAAWSAI